jgi:hypothetical protein
MIQIPKDLLDHHVHMRLRLSDMYGVIIVKNVRLDAMIPCKPPIALK